MKIRFIVFSLILLSIISDAFGQELQDGTTTSIDFFNEVVKNFFDENTMQFDTTSPDIDVTVPIAVYLVLDSNGKEILDNNIIQQSISDINRYFKPCGIKFTMSSFIIVGDFNYSYITTEKMPTELLKKHKQGGAINLYLVDRIMKENTPVHGFTFYPTDSTKNYIFMTKSVFHENNLTTQLGHFFGLLSTHEKMNTYGLADNSNCSSTGDLICDTWPARNLFEQVDEKCNYIGMVTDLDQKFYTPSTANFMSNSSVKCKCIFTFQQYRRMHYYYKKYRERCFNKM